MQSTVYCRRLCRLFCALVIPGFFVRRCCCHCVTKMFVRSLPACQFVWLTIRTVSLAPAFARAPESRAVSLAASLSLRPAHRSASKLSLPRSRRASHIHSVFSLGCCFVKQSISIGSNQLRSLLRFSIQFRRLFPSRVPFGRALYERLSPLRRIVDGRA